jgi:formylglycine-generating enzyme required for sulfatase activity
VNDDEERVEVKFIAEAALTRTSVDGNQWTIGDELGIYMITAGNPLSSTSISGGADNRKYQPQEPKSSSALNPVDIGQTIYFPQDGQVDFIAYYPRKETGMGVGQINEFLYPIDLADQNNPAAIDLLYARKANMSKGAVTVNLSFTHPLSKIILHVEKGNDISAVNFASATAEISGTPATANFLLASGQIGAKVTGSFYAMKASTTATFDATFEALLIPHSAMSGRKVTFSAEGNTYEWSIPDTAIFEAGMKHIYKLTIYASGAEEERVLTIPFGSINPWTDVDYSAIQPIDKVLITAGSFLMGSPATEPDRDANESAHTVSLTQNFYISRYEITNAQYATFLNLQSIAGTFEGHPVREGKLGANTLIYESNQGLYWDAVTGMWKPSASRNDYPVVNVTWYGADAYARWVGGSLPTEAQWEYACRAGTATPFAVSPGTELYADQANFNGGSPYALPGGAIMKYLGYDGHPNTYLEHSTPVGSYLPNAWGLYDMHGNVMEWCNDWWHVNYGGEPPIPPASDPTGPTTGTYRVVRGGDYSKEASACRSASRYYATLSTYWDQLGFRVVFPAE